MANSIIPVSLVFPVGAVPADKGLATGILMAVIAPANTVLSVVSSPAGAVNASLEVLGWVVGLGLTAVYHGGPTVTLGPDAPVGVDVTLFVRAKTDLFFLLPPTFHTDFVVHGAGTVTLDSDTIRVEGSIVGPEVNRAALDLALDRSQFMDVTTVARVKLACFRLLDFMTEADWLGICFFTASCARKVEVMPLTPAHRIDAELTISALKRVATGDSSVYKASTTVVNGLNELPGLCPCSPAGRALFVMSMGVENVTGFFPPAPSTTQRFCAALGTTEGVLPLVVTTPSQRFKLGDDSTPDEMFKLEKFLLQSLAEVSGLSTLHDPVGTLSGAQVVKIPFDVADTDSNVRIVVLVDNPELVRLDLDIGDGMRLPVLEFPGASITRGRGSLEFALDRTVLEQTAHGEEHCKPRKRDPRVKPKGQAGAVTPAPSTTWHAVLSLSKTGLAHGGRLKPVPYTAIVFADSDLRFRASANLDSDCIGGTAFLSAWLTEFGAPITGKRVRVWAEVTYPDGGRGTLALSESVGGRFEAQLRCTIPGTHCFRILAAGTTFRGKRFRRELTRTTRTQSGPRHDCAPCVPTQGHPPRKQKQNRTAALARTQDVAEDDELDDTEEA